MAKRIALNTLNASTVDILNTIRANASYEYQSMVPEVQTNHDIPRVGEVLYGYPALANQFINSLVNRIALVRVKSAVFNNAYSMLKKGYLEFGETVEEVFVNIAKAREFSAEKAEARELKRSLPDVRTAFHAMNWRVQYPITIQDEDLRTAFLSVNGVQDLIAKIVDAVYTAAEYDEFLLFKYMLIKAISHGKVYPVAVGNDMKDAAVKFRSLSNKMQFISTTYNASGVHTATPKRDQYIFMDADYNAQYDVNVLAAAFNMDKAEFSGKLMLIDDWKTFDNARFEEIRAASDMIEEVRPEELKIMSKVRGVLVDGEWFQVYDNNNKFTEKYVSSGMYWNYFYNVWKTVSSSPFSNIVVFVDDTDNIGINAETYHVMVTDKSADEQGVTLTLRLQEQGLEDSDGRPVVHNTNVEFVQTSSATEQGVAVHKYGAVMFSHPEATFNLVIMVDGQKYTSTTACIPAARVGTIYELTKG